MRRALAVLLLLFCAAFPARAQEVIREFLSDVTVNADGSLNVREEITVVSQMREIRRGILRDFPTTYTDKNGIRVRVGLEVLDVERDGRDENFKVESISNGKRIRIGNADVLLNPGLHTYSITYRTTRQVGFFETFDELYWNVTGNGWTFPIERAETMIRLPEGAQIGNTSVYTGLQGLSGRDARITAKSGNRFQAETTRPLERNEGFTVAVAWQKGIVAPASEAQKQKDWIADNIGYFILGLTSLLVPLYYVWAWLRVGRDPPKGRIIPLFRPPEGMGAADVRYAYNHGYDDRAFAAGVVGLAVKGRMGISSRSGDYTVEKKSSDTSGLTRSEAALLGAAPNNPLLLEQDNHVKVSRMRDALQHALDDEYGNKLFLNNFMWFALGLVLSGLGLLLAGIMMPEGQGAPLMFSGVFTTIWWGVILLIVFSAFRSAKSGGILSLIKGVGVFLFLIPFMGAGVLVPVMTWFTSEKSPAMLWFIVAAVFVALLNLIFYWLLKAPTTQGRALLDQIEGFRMYMTTAEEKRLDALHPPEKTPELFERYLPYAMALDCENEWNKKFAAVLAAAAAAGAAGAAVGGWYSGPGGFNSSGFSRDLGSSLTSSISSSGTAPGSSSGSGGGGFSGGGGGGGGGSGW
jgi:hypothetical protein